jgi:hypothetical protein
VLATILIVISIALLVLALAGAVILIIGIKRAPKDPPWGK